MNARPAVLPKANERCWCGSTAKYGSCHREADRRAGAVRPRSLAEERRLWRDEAFAEMKAGRPPDFQLAPLIQLDRTLLLPLENEPIETTQLKRLALTLALIFNDLKDLLWAGLVVQHFTLELSPTEISAESGQLNAMRNFFLRHANGVIAELGSVIEGRKEVIQSAAFKAAVRGIDQTKALDAWNSLVAAFEKVPIPGAPKRGSNAPKAATSKIARYIKHVRDKAAYHYGNRPDEDAVLAHGYAKKFKSPKTGDASAAHAYLCVGDSMNTSRFFFADAAVQAVVDEALTEHDVSAEELNAFFRDVNFALRFVVASLLQHFKEVQLEG